MRLNNKALHPVLIPILAFLFILSLWYFFWPLVECTYAFSWNPLFNGGIIKLSLFVIGGIIFFVTVWVTHKILL